MPNVKIFGFFGSEDGAYPLKGRRELEQAVRGCLRRLPFAKDAVITLIDSACLDLQGEHTPYLEVSSSNSEHIKSIVKALESLGYDIETTVLHGFYPTKK